MKSDGSSVNFYVSDVKEIEELVLSDPALAKRCKVNNIQKPSWVITTLLPYGLGIIAIFFLFSFLSAQSAGAGGIHHGPLACHLIVSHHIAVHSGLTQMNMQSVSVMLQA